MRTALSFLRLVAFLSLLSCLHWSPASASAVRSARDILVPGFRPPSIPIIVLSPTVSMWVNADNLTDSWITHWSGPTMAMVGMLSVDGAVFRFLGPEPAGVPAMSQTRLLVTPTQTQATFTAGGLQLNLTFSQAAFPSDLSFYSRPYAYITVSVCSVDGAQHSVSVYLDHAADVVVNQGRQTVDWADVSSQLFRGTAAAASARALRLGSYDNIPFINRGDATRNEWGHAYFAINSQRLQTAVQASTTVSRAAFAAGAEMPPPDTRRPRHAEDGWVGSVFVLQYGSVGSAAVSEFAVFAWDERLSMFFFHEQHEPLWRHAYRGDVGAMLQAAFADYEQIISKCEAFDSASLSQLAAAGGDEYATFTALAHRQATGATIVVWNAARQSAWAYMKEISSDGDVSTVDVIYPASPFFVLYGPELLRLTLLPILAYGQNETDIPYRLPWAPHHLGAWPVSDILGEEQEQMPMEESANLLIMLAAIARQQDGQVAYLKPYFAALTQWAHYLNSSLPDPGEQLCTDDFEGPSPHNVNLALKGILGLGSFSLLLNYSGQTELGAAYWRSAQAFVQDWLRMALDDSGDHYRLQYDLNNTWSTKYNLAYQSILGLQLFPQSVADLEVAWYLRHARAFGVPLDSRSDMVKCDWLSWAAALASKQEDAEALLHFLFLFADESPSRSPFSDWYNSTTNRQIGFTARPVMGGLYARTLIHSLSLHQQQPDTAAAQHSPGQRGHQRRHASLLSRLVR